MNYRSRNVEIKRHLLMADGVIYQSQFSKVMADRYLGKVNCVNAVISNGADPDWFDRMSPVAKPHKYMFIAANRWRPQKRLRDIIRCFQTANISDSGLWIAGNLSKSGVTREEQQRLFSDSRVQYLGVLGREALASRLMSCVACIHLSWIDWCPNSVVEAIAAGLVVITNNVGGTRELVGPSGGIVCGVDAPYYLKPVKLYEPPDIDRNVIAEAMHRVVSEKLIVLRSHVNIRLISEKYLRFFKRVVG